MSASKYDILEQNADDSIISVALSDLEGGVTDSYPQIATAKESELLIHDDTPYCSRIWILIQQATPVTLCFAISMATSFITQFYAGRYEVDGNKSIVFAGIALGAMYYNVTCRSVLLGITTAIDTLASQHNGAQNYREVGLVLQRAIVILLLVCVPLSPFWIFAEQFFEYLQIDPKVGRVIGMFVNIRVLALPADVVSECFEKYLMAVGEMSIPMYTTVIIGGVIVAANIIMPWYIGYETLAWSVVLSEYVGLAFMIGSAWRCPSVQRTLQPWSMDLFLEWKEFLWLGFPGLIMLCSEWWAFELLTIFASLISTEAVAAQAVIMQLSTLGFMFPLGLGITTTSFIGNSLGADKKQLAIEIGRMSYVVMIGLECMISASILLFGGAFVRVFALDEEVRSIAYTMIPYLALFVFVDGVQGISSGVLRGAGRQAIGAMCNIVLYYAVGIPAAWYLCFHTSFGVRGLILGIFFAVLLQTMVFCTLIFGYEDYIYQSVLETAGAGAGGPGSLDHGIHKALSMDDEVDDYDADGLELMSNLSPSDKATLAAIRASSGNDGSDVDEEDEDDVDLESGGDVFSSSISVRNPIVSEEW